MKSGSGLGDAYTATLTRLKTQTGYKSILGLKVLMWVLNSEQPLGAEELCHALGVEIGSADLDPENVFPLRALLTSCLGLVTVEASSSTLRLVHSTLREHLSSNPTLFDSPHSTIAEVCLTYLNFRCVRDLSPIARSVPSTMLFLEYASRYWGKHTRRGMTENAKLLALKLLDRFDEHISAQLLLLHYNQTKSSGPYFDNTRGPTRFTGLHGVAFFGIAEIVAAVLEMKKWGVNAVDCMGSTALTWATRGGHEETVRALLKQEDIDPNIVDTHDGRTPLTRAVENGHEGLVKILLERRDTNPNTVDTQYGRTPLLSAIDHGHDRVVKILLEREDVNADQACAKCGRTPLSLAAGRGDERVVKMFLGREDVNPNTADTGCGQTPLSWAAEHGHAGVVKMLLEGRDVNPNAADTEYGRTPLSWAAGNGHTGVVKVLLERKDVRTVMPDSKNETPLSLALSKGHDGVVRILQEQDNAHSGPGSRSGQASLPPSAGDGGECVVEMGLRHDDPNTDTANLIGQPLVIKPTVEKSVVEKPRKISIHNCKHISKTLENMIMNQRKGLRNMYGETGAELDKSLKVPIKRGEEMVRKLVEDMGCPLEIAKDLTVLTLYDMAILIGMF